MTESKSRAASKRAASKNENENATEAQVEEQRESGKTPVTGEFDAGPGTGKDAPPENTARYPSTVVNPDSAPLDPPADAHTQTQPEQGYNDSSTNHVYAAAGGRTIAGEDHARFVDQDGTEIAPGDMFDDDPSKTYVTAKQRIYEEFYYQNTNEPARRLLYAQGRRVPRFVADRVRDAANNAPTPAAVADGRTEGQAGNAEGQAEGNAASE